MKTITIFATIFSIFVISNTHASNAIETCKRLFDEAAYQQALETCLEAGMSGHLDSQSILGEIYDRQDNAKETLYWWNKAAMSGYLPARNQLAMKFYYGGSVFGPEKGWKQDYHRAYNLWIEDARNGEASAQFMAAEMHQQGQGVPQDFVEAWVWFNLALEQGYQLASDSLYELSRKMTPNQLQAGKQKLIQYREQINSKQAGKN